MLLQFLVGWLYCHVGEYFIHKNVLHNHKNFKFAFKNHFSNHHKASRINLDMSEPKYGNQSISDLFFDSEIRMIFLLVSLHFPIYFLFPGFFFAVLFSGVMYYFLHRLSHTRPKSFGRLMPWHTAHHLGKNQNINWGVRLPIVDIIMKTSDYSMWKKWKDGENVIDRSCD